jgi:hypothetical protein
VLIGQFRQGVGNLKLVTGNGLPIGDEQTNGVESFGNVDPKPVRADLLHFHDPYDFPFPTHKVTSWGYAIYEALTAYLVSAKKQNRTIRE